MYWDRLITSDNYIFLLLMQLMILYCKMWLDCSQAVEYWCMASSGVILVRVYIR